MHFRILVMLVALVVAGCSGENEDQPSGMETCLNDDECDASMACRHISGVDEGMCVKACTSCSASDICTSIDQLEFPSSCFHTCDAGCAPGFWCWAQGLCLPDSWRDAVCEVYPDLNGCT